MEYIDWKYFSIDYLGKGVSCDEFPRLNARAQEMIDAITRGVIAKRGLTSFSDDVQELVKRAVCCQVEYFGNYGEEIGYEVEDTGFSVGKVSVQGGSKANGNSYSLAVCPRAKMLLEQTGLLNRSVCLC